MLLTSAPHRRPRLDSQREEIKLANRTYEVMYIVDPETPGDKVKKLNEAVGKLIETQGGTIVRCVLQPR